jgi:4-hydroxy-tetrahydrodipicolinate synthase
MPVDTDNSTLDTPRAIAHAKRMLAAGCDGVTLFGTTGEGPAFTVAERKACWNPCWAAGVRADQLWSPPAPVHWATPLTWAATPVQPGGAIARCSCPRFFRQPVMRAALWNPYRRWCEALVTASSNCCCITSPSSAACTFSHASIQTLVQRHPGQVIGVKDSSGDWQHSLALAKAFPELSILVGSEPHVAHDAGGRLRLREWAGQHCTGHLMRRVIALTVTGVSAEDEKLMLALLALLSVLPNMSFVSVYKTMLAEQTGDNAWLNVRAPLTHLENTEAQTVRSGYRAIGSLLHNV